MTLAPPFLFRRSASQRVALYPTGWGVSRLAGNPVIDVDDNPGETHEQYVPAPIRLANGDIWVYVKGSYVIYAWLSTDDGETFSLQNAGDPVIDLGAGGTWNDTAIVEPCVVYDEANGTIHFYVKGTGSLTNPVNWDIGHYTADDSDPTTLTPDAGNPISTATDASTAIGYNVYDYAISDVIKIGSTFHFYGYVKQGTTEGGSVYTLLQATGTDWDDISGIETIYAAPNTSVIYGHPTVVRIPGVGAPVYAMLYTYGSAASTPRSIRGIQSSDGETWSAPDAVDILAPVPTSWEGDWVYAQGLLKVNVDPWALPYVDGSGRWLLYYSGQSDQGGAQPAGHHDNTGLVFLTPT